MNPLLQPLEELAESWPHDVEFILDGKADIHLNLCRRCNLERVLRESGLAELLEAGQAMRENIGAYAVALNAQPFKQEDTSRAIRGCVDGLQAWDRALAKVKGK